MRWLAVSVLMLFGVVVAQAGLINRPTKSCGTTTYTDEVANGCPTILAAEVDGDLNTIYGEFNGGISNDNVSPTAAIACSKIATGSCTGTQIQNGSICSAQIGDGCIANVDVSPTAAIAGSKLAVGAAVRSSDSSACNDGFDGVSDLVLVTLGPVTTGGGRVLITGQCALTWLMGTSSSSIVFQWIKDGVGVEFTTYPVVPGTALSQVPIPTPGLVDTPTAASHTYRLEATILAPGAGALKMGTVAIGSYFLTELR